MVARFHSRTTAAAAAKKLAGGRLHTHPHTRIRHKTAAVTVFPPYFIVGDDDDDDDKPARRPPFGSPLPMSMPPLPPILPIAFYP